MIFKDADTTNAGEVTRAQLRDALESNANKLKPIEAKFMPVVQPGLSANGRLRLVLKYSKL